MNREFVSQLKTKGVLSAMDTHFARLMEKLSGENLFLFMAAAFASSQTRMGNVCLNLETVSSTPLLYEDELLMTYPERALWVSSLEASSVVGKPGEYKPLILEDKKRLYLYRYWDYQKKLSDFIIDRTEKNIICETDKTGTLKGSLDRLFPQKVNGDTDWQKIAAYVAFTKGFSVISGGPGTGKTTTVSKILVLLAEQHLALNPKKKLRVILAAPTGKAAARLKDSILSAWGKIDCSEEVRELVPEEASTIHRMLGTINGTPYFRYNEKRKLPADVVIVDEASMVDLALMSKLVTALPEHTKLILLGDQDQLASVEAGAVLGDICNTGSSISYSPAFVEEIKALDESFVEHKGRDQHESGLSDCITVLKKSYRFGDDSGIGAVSRAANKGDAEFFARCFSNERFQDVRFYDLPGAVDLEGLIRDKIISGYNSFLSAKDPVEKFHMLTRFRVICAVIRGPYGVETINRMAERILTEEGLIQSVDEWYPGRPVIVTQNDYSLGLFNGDVGITMHAEEPGHDLEVCFMDSNGLIRAIKTQNLPKHETVYAMTVHKCQGSEFDKVLLILPDYETPVLTRELIYTAITRARNHVDIISRKNILNYAVLRRTQRMTGLRDALWKK